MKRLIALWLVAALLSGGLTATGAETEEKVNLFQNPGFEEATFEKGPYDAFDASVGKPKNWGSFNGWTDDAVNNAGIRARWTTNEVKFGSRCANIRLDPGVSNIPQVNQIVSDLTPGGIYEIGFFAKSLKGTSAFYLAIHFMKDGEVLRSQSMLRTLPDKTWTKYSLKFPFPDDADSMRVEFSLSGYGDIYLDDVFLYKISDKPVFALETDAVFYYSDDPTLAVAKVSAENPGEATASFVLKEGNAVVGSSKEDISFADGVAKWEFPISLMVKEKAAYTLETTVTKNGEKTLLTKEVYRYPRPSRLRSDGVYLKNGEPFVPVIGHSADAEHFEKCKEAGINVVTIGYWYAFYDEYIEGTKIRRIDYVLDLLDQYDLMGIICLYRYMLPSGDSANKQNTTDLLLHLADHKHRDHIFAYDMMDEPLQNDVWCDEELQYGYKRIRDLDGEIPVITVDCSDNPSTIKRNMSYCDIYMCDAYYAGNGELSHWPGEIIALTKSVAEEGGRSVYHLTQAFEWNGQFPNDNEIRHMLYQAFLNGAQGVGYFKISNAVYKRDESGEVIKDAGGNIQLDHLVNSDRWPGLCAFGTGDLPIAADHFVLGKYPKIADIDGEGYTGRIWEKDGEAYVLLLSESETENKTVSVFLPYETFCLSEYGEAPHALIENGKIEYTLSPRECMLFVCEEIGVLHLLREDGTVAESPKKGETIRAEVLKKADAEISIPLLAAYAAEGGELVALEALIKNDGDICDTFTCTFEVPDDGLSYKAFLWDEMLRSHF